MSRYIPNFDPQKLRKRNRCTFPSNTELHHSSSCAIDSDDEDSGYTTDPDFYSCSNSSSSSSIISCTISFSRRPPSSYPSPLSPSPSSSPFSSSSSLLTQLLKERAEHDAITTTTHSVCWRNLLTFAANAMAGQPKIDFKLREWDDDDSYRIISDTIRLDKKGTLGPKVFFPPRSRAAEAEAEEAAAEGRDVKWFRQGGCEEEWTHGW